MAGSPSSTGSRRISVGSEVFAVPSAEGAGAEKIRLNRQNSKNAKYRIVYSYRVCRHGPPPLAAAGAVRAGAPRPCGSERPLPHGAAAFGRPCPRIGSVVAKGCGIAWYFFVRGSRESPSRQASLRSLRRDDHEVNPSSLAGDTRRENDSRDPAADAVRRRMSCPRWRAEPAYAGRRGGAGAGRRLGAAPASASRRDRARQLSLRGRRAKLPALGPSGGRCGLAPRLLPFPPRPAAGPFLGRISHTLSS